MASFLQTIKKIPYSLPSGYYGGWQAGMTHHRNTSNISASLMPFLKDKGERALFAAGLGVARGMDKGTIKGVEVELAAAAAGYVVASVADSYGVIRHSEILGDAGLMTAAYRVGASWGAKRAGR